MPHCIIEHANDLMDSITPEEMMDAAFKAMQLSGLFETNDIKIRTKEYAYFQAGESRKNFIHVTLKILDGRSLLQKQELANLLVKGMDTLPIFDIEITVDVQDMNVDTYRKIIN